MQDSFEFPYPCLTSSKSKANPNEGAARGEAKLAWIIPSRDRARLSQTKVANQPLKERGKITISPVAKPPV